jgi:hypothetical protein
MLDWLRRMLAPRWRLMEYGLPRRPGYYRVMISGDSESLEGHTIYEYSDYETWAYFAIDDENGTFTGVHDEETDMIFAFCGPIAVPPFKE